jgi:hypothetical protein
VNVTIKLSTEADQERIRRLAELDSGRAPQGDVLLAEVNGRLLAAIGMDGTVVADPFERTTAVVKMLRSQLAGKPPRAPLGRRRLTRVSWLPRDRRTA